MAALQITCKNPDCGHVFYRIAVQCQIDNIDTTCPHCGHPEGMVHVVKRDDGKTPFAPCVHL